MTAGGVFLSPSELDFVGLGECPEDHRAEPPALRAVPKQLFPSAGATARPRPVWGR